MMSPQDAGAAPAPVPVNMPGPAPVFAPTPAPQVTRTPTVGEQQISNDQQQLQKVRWNQANPWGTADNHPGTMGKIAHVLSVAGNIAGDIFAPATMMNIPGTELNEKANENQLAHRLNSEVAQNSVDSARDQETAEAPQRAADTHNQSSALTREANDKAAELEDAPAPEPSLATAYAHAVNQAIKENRDPAQDPIVQHISDAITSLQKQPAPAKMDYQTTVGPDGKPHVYGLDAQGNKVADEGVHYEKPNVVNVNSGRAQDRAEKNDILKAYQPTLDSAERMNVMTESYEKAIKDHDQQAMLNLLANHLGMTMGLQKGARMTKDIINEAKQSQPWLQGMQSKFDSDGYLSGVTLSPQQMRQMVGLGQSRYAEDAKKSRATAQYMGAPDDGPDRVPGSATMRYYLGQTGGNAAQAKALAAQDGWTVGK
jgi:hypothetical protein